jgi:GAF domain-containing protein
MSKPSLRQQQLSALLDTRDWPTNAAQSCVFIMARFQALNWVGFYLQRRPDSLVLGPFQGYRPAIPFLSIRACAGPRRARVARSVSMMWVRLQRILSAMRPRARSWSSR